MTPIPEPLPGHVPPVVPINHGPAYGVTKDEHDKWVAEHGRPYTQDLPRAVAGDTEEE